MGRSTRNFFAKNDIVLCVPGRPEHIGTDLTTLPCIQTRSVDMDMYNTYRCLVALVLIKRINPLADSK